jgi:hypothetical protein
MINKVEGLAEVYKESVNSICDGFWVIRNIKPILEDMGI